VENGPALVGPDLVERGLIELPARLQPRLGLGLRDLGGRGLQRAEAEGGCGLLGRVGGGSGGRVSSGQARGEGGSREQLANLHGKPPREWIDEQKDGEFG